MYMRRVFNARVLVVAFLVGVVVCAGSQAASGQSCTAACLNRVETFTQPQTFGSGTFSATNSFTGGATTAFILGLLGTTVSPNTNTGTGFIFENIQNTNSDTNASNTGAFLMKKYGSLSNSRGTALYSEVEDLGGGGTSGGNFAEGSRSTCTGSVGTVNCYGSIHMAQTNSGINHGYLVGDESGILDGGSVAPGSTFNKNSFTAAYLAGCSQYGAQNCDSGFVTNPFSSPRSFREGFLVAESSVSEAAFRSRAATGYGLDLCSPKYPTGVNGCQASETIGILVPNGVPIDGMNAAGTDGLTEIYVNSSNSVVVGDDTRLANIVLGNSGVRVYVAQYSSSTSGALCYDGTGYISVCTSSRKFKTDIAPLDSALDEVTALAPVAYTSKTSGRREIGFVAEDVEQLDSRLSTYNKDGLVGVQYDHLTALLAKAVQEQQSEIESLRAEIEALKKEHR